MKHRVPTLLALAALAVVGVLAGFLFVPAASAWSIDNLPAGLRVSEHGVDSSAGSDCPEWYTLGVYTDGHFTTYSGKLCTNSQTFQQDFDAFVDSHYTPPPTTAPPETVTTEPTETAPPAPVTQPTCDVQCQIDALNARVDGLAQMVAQIRSDLTSLTCILQKDPTLDPALLAQLMSIKAECPAAP